MHAWNALPEVADNGQALTGFGGRSSALISAWRACFVDHALGSEWDNGLAAQNDLIYAPWRMIIDES